MFITFEGIEGSGKTTQIKNVAEFLKGRGYDVLVTREPGGTEIGKNIRSILLSPLNKNIDPLTELLLYLADRVQHVKEFIEASLNSGKIVLCDRYMDATVVYQGFARGLGVNFIYQIHNFLLPDIKPNLTILMDLDVSIGLSRAKKQIDSGDRSNKETRFEEESISFHKKVREGYLEVANLDPCRFKIVDASLDENQVKNIILNHLLEIIGKK
ncbi:MAG: dTMP kinase [Desulfobacterales bacterium]|nr:dTMP kinase [Desulfobacterales bacterium]MBF0396969.1 dTMP kinase [Desulfobacterales bacterium]